MVFVRVIGCHSEDGDASAQYVVPYLGRAEKARRWDGVVVALACGVEHFHQARAARLEDRFVVEGSLPARVVDAGYSARVSNGVYVGLECGGDVSCINRLYEAVYANCAKVYGDSVAFQGKSDFLARNHQRAERAVHPVAVVEQREVIMVGEDEEVVAVFSVPGGYLLRFGVAVGFGCVGVDISPVPSLFVHI